MTPRAAESILLKLPSPNTAIHLDGCLAGPGLMLGIKYGARALDAGAYTVKVQFWPGTSVVVDAPRAAVGFSDITVALAPHNLNFHCPSGSQELLPCPFQAEELKHAVATRLV